MRLPFRLGGEPGRAVRSTTPTGADGGTPLRVMMQWGLVDLSAYVTGMTISERMGAPDSLSLQLADVDAAIALSIVETLADIHVTLAGADLFRGQITTSTTETINYQQDEGVWIASRTIDISAESYERLIPDAILSPSSPGSGRIMADGSLNPTNGYGVGWGHTDRDDVMGLFRYWWTGPAIDSDTYVHATGSSSGGWVFFIDNMAMSAAMDALAANASVPTVVHWLDAGMRFHWADGADPAQLDAAPFNISSVGFGVGTLMSMRMTISTDAQNLRRRALMQGALPWVIGLVYNPAAAAYTPDASISSGKATTWDDAVKFAERYFANDSRVGLSGSATVTGIYGDGWHKGQWVLITDPGHDLDAKGFLVQGVTARLLSGGATPLFEYDVQFGDAPRRSLASESANPDIPVDTPAVRYAMRTDPEQSTPTPTVPVKIIAQLHDGIRNLTTAGINLRWDLIIGGGMAEADPTLTTLAFYLEDAIGTTNEQGQTTTIAHTGTAFDPAAGLACTVEAVTEAPA